jgi:hypothetical protein
MTIQRKTLHVHNAEEFSPPTKTVVTFLCEYKFALTLSFPDVRISKQKIRINFRACVYLYKYKIDAIKLCSSFAIKLQRKR